MANEIQAQTTSGLTLYAVLIDTTGQAWNGATWETLSAANWTTYDIAMTEAAAGIYFGDMPAVAAGVYQFVVYDQAGVDPATSDSQVDSGSISWAGSVVTTPSASTRYGTVAALKSRLGITDAVDDDAIAAALDAVSRWIDNYCNRHFYTAAATRYYTTTYTDHVMIDDCVSLSDVATDADLDRTYTTTWAAADWELEPVNAAADGAPYDALYVTPEGDYSFPRSRRGVKLTGVWGWPAVPGPITEAALLQGARVFKRRDTPQGVMGSAELGFVRVSYRLDPDVQQMLDPYRKIAVA